MATTWKAPTWRMPNDKNQSKFESYSLDSEGYFSINPNLHAYGQTNFTVYLTDDEGGESGIYTYSLTINSVNDPPSFNITSENIDQIEDCGFIQIDNFITDYSILLFSNVIYWLGDFSEEPTHDPIPNSTVKLLSADGTAS